MGPPVIGPPQSARPEDRRRAGLRRAACLYFVPALVLIALALAVLLLQANRALFLLVHGRLVDTGTIVWCSLTLLGDALVAPLLVVPFLRRRPGLLWAGTLAAVAATCFTHVLKPIVHMPRPPAVFDLTVIGPRLLAGSFPSGHTATAFTVLGLLVLAGAWRSRVATVLATLLACAIGVSRVVVGVHWPADVLAGAAGGWAAAGLALFLAPRLRWGSGPVAIVLQRAVLAALALFDLFGHDTGYAPGLPVQHALALLALGWLAWDSFAVDAGEEGGQGGTPTDH